MQQKQVIVNILILGHANSGKSTLAGQLLHKLRCNNPKTNVQQNSTQAAAQENNKYIQIISELKSQLELGNTICIESTGFSTKKYQYCIVELSGHKNFYKNLISGYSKVDIAILIVSAVQGDFENDLKNSGLFRQHASFVFALGINHLIVCINKIDGFLEGNLQARLQQIQALLSKELGIIGFKPPNIQFIPCSGLLGENILQKDVQLQFYKGPTLIEALDSFSLPKRPVDKPLRLPIQDVYKIGGIGTVPVGRVESGFITVGLKIIFTPSNIMNEVHEIVIPYQFNYQGAQGEPGDNIGFNVKQVTVKDIRRGFVCSNIDEQPAKETISFLAYVIIIKHPYTIEKNHIRKIYCHTSSIDCEFQELHQRIQRRNGKCLEEQPKLLKYGDVGLVKLVPLKPMCIEAFRDYPTLGRFIVKDQNETTAVGIIVKVETKQS